MPRNAFSVLKPSKILVEIFVADLALISKRYDTLMWTGFMMVIIRKSG
jgi:hypothetical protein